MARAKASKSKAASAPKKASKPKATSKSKAKAKPKAKKKAPKKAPKAKASPKKATPKKATKPTRRRRATVDDHDGINGEVADGTVTQPSPAMGSGGTIAGGGGEVVRIL